MKSITAASHFRLIVFLLSCLLVFYPVLNNVSSLSGNEVLDAYLRAFPDVKSIGVIYSEPKNEVLIKELERTAKAKKIEVLKVRAKSIKDFPDALRILKDDVDTFWVLDDQLFSMSEAWNYFIMISLRNRIKTVVFSEKALASGGLFYYTDKKEIMINRRIIGLLGLKVSEKAGPVKYFEQTAQKADE